MLLLSFRSAQFRAKSSLALISTVIEIRIISTLRSILLILFLSITIAACASRAPEIKPSTPAYYTVKAGDNLASIAFMLSTTPGTLLSLNPHIQDQTITAGMRLVTPSAQPVEYTDQAEYDGSGFIWPVKTRRLSSRFGNRNGRLHTGIDLRAPRGTAILASAAGKVVYTGIQNGYGRIVIIKHSAKIQTAYAHNLKNLVHVGQAVKQGQTIARIGRSGNSTGYHVHFELRHYGKPVDPVKYLRQ